METINFGNIYICSGWFNDEMLKACLEIESAANDLVEQGKAISVFEPRNMNLGISGCNWELIFKRNIEELDKCDTVLCSTVNKDMGSIFEAGYAYAKNKRIIYYTPGINKPNLMLGKSGLVFNNIKTLINYLTNNTIIDQPNDYE